LTQPNPLNPSLLTKHGGPDDPNTILFQPGPSGPNVFKHNALSSYVDVAGQRCHTGFPFFLSTCEQLISNSTHTAVAISNNTIGDISLASGKELQIAASWFWGNVTGCCDFAAFGWYLTTNSTIPSHAIGSAQAYNPIADPSVVILMQIAQNGIGGANYHLLLQRQTAGTQRSLQQQLTGCTTNAGSEYICADGQSLNLVVGSQTDIRAYALNYTGAGGSGSTNGRSQVTLGYSTTNLQFNSTVLPWLNLQQGQLYLGLYMMPKGGSDYSIIDWMSNQFQIDIFTPIVVNVQPPSPLLDTGGFFGPIIQFLVNAGIFIFQNIVAYASFVYTIFIFGLNLIGAWLGLGTIGSNLDSFLKAFIQFMAQMATIIANLGSGITVLINDISFGATFIVGLLTATASWLSAAVLLGGKLKDIFDLVFRYGNNMIWIFFWSTFFLYTATGEGWSGTLEFFNAVNWASSLGANFVIRMVNFGVQAIAFLKGFIPTEAGAPPPTSPVSEGGKPSGASLQSTAKPVAAQPSRLKAGFSRANISRARGSVATKFRLSASRPAAPSFSAALEWDPIKVILLLGGLLLLMLWIGGGLSPFGAPSATCTSTTAPTAGNTARCFQTSYDILSQITAPILLMFASIGSITFLADKFGMIGSTFSGPTTFRAIPRRHVRQRRELMKLRAREKQLRMEFKR